MTELAGAGMTQTKESNISDSVGFVAANVQIKVVDEKTGKILGPNNPGELHFKSPAMMLGYYKNPTETKEAFDEDGI